MAYLITGKATDYDGRPFQVRKGQRVTVKSLLKMNDERLRSAVVAASKNLIAEFPARRARFQDGGDPLNSSQINEFFDGTSPVCDCLGAAKLVMARGMINFLLPGEFDQVYRLSSIPYEHIKGTAADARNGDWGYIQNDLNYLDVQLGGGYQGENVIKVGNDQFWGFPGGKKSMAEWERTLIGAYNGGLPATDQIKTIPGWRQDGNKFIDVSKVSMRMFDHRKRMLDLEKQIGNE